MNKLACFLGVLLVASAPSFSQQSPATPATVPDSKPAAQASPRKPDRASSYYHYTMAHIYEELVTVYGRSDLANKAIEEYRQAIEADPGSAYLTSGLAELYAKTGRIRDAVLEAVLHDSNADVRAQAISLLEPVDADSAVREVLQTVANRDQDQHIRSVSRQYLEQVSLQ